MNVTSKKETMNAIKRATPRRDLHVVVESIMRHTKGKGKRTKIVFCPSQEQKSQDGGK